MGEGKCSEETYKLFVAHMMIFLEHEVNKTYLFNSIYLQQTITCDNTFQ